MRKVFLFLCFFSLFSALPAEAQRGALTRQQTLDELVAESHVIIRGTVVSARVEPHPTLSKIQTVVVRLRVEESLKGTATETYEFRQFIWDARDRLDAASYRKGQHLLLLLIAPNQYGLSSPAGLEQGRFRIQKDASGNEVAVNGNGNAGLFLGVQGRVAKKGIKLSATQAQLAESHTSGPVHAADLSAMIRQLAGVK